MARKKKFEECYGGGVLVNLYALMEAFPGGAGILLGDWSKEATTEGRNGEPWVFWRVPWRPAPEPYNWHEEQERLKGMAAQAEAMRDVLKGRGVPAVLWCSEWGPPRAPTAAPPKGQKVDPYKAFKRAVREMKAAIKEMAPGIKEELAELEAQQEQLEAEGDYLDEYPALVGCLDPTTGLIYEIGIEWPQYFQGCGGPGPWNEITSFYMDLDDPKEMLANVESVVGEAMEPYEDSAALGGLGAGADMPNLPPYYWVITKDKLARPGGRSDVGVGGPRYTGITHEEIMDRLKKANVEWTRFRMLDDDGNIYYYGKMYANEQLKGGMVEFSPLHNFGAPNAGCTEIQYYEPPPEGGPREWRPL